MRIGIDCRFAVESQPRGTGRYIRYLVNTLVALAPEHEYIFYVHRADNLAVLPQTPRAKTVCLSLPLIFYPFWEQCLLPMRAVADRLDVLHCAGSTGPMLLSRRTRYVVTIHDVSFLLPESVMPKPESVYQRLGRSYRRWVVPRVAQRADCIIAVSQYTCNEIVEFTGVVASKTRVIYHGSNMAVPYMKRNDGHALPMPYILCLSGEAPHKNVERMLRVWASLVAAGQNRHTTLVLVGVSKKSQYWQQVEASGCQSYTHFIDFVVDQSALASLYLKAEFVVYPSLYESFGLPALEAMACGVPIITSNVAAIPEIVGDAALLIDPYSDASLAAAVCELLQNTTLRKELAERGLLRAASFSREQAARETLAVYINAANS